jgi:hypothetical protein
MCVYVSLVLRSEMQSLPDKTNSAHVPVNAARKNTECNTKMSRVHSENNYVLKTITEVLELDKKLNEV